MEAKRIITAVIVGLMVISGLGIVSFGSIAETEPIQAAQVIYEPPVLKSTEPTISYGTIPGYEPHSVARTVFAEDYTEWGCVPCASHNPAWNAAITALGYDVVAPSFVHVNWPAGTDPLFYYTNVDGSVQDRVTYYGITYVPWPINDGTYIDYGQTQAYYETAFNTRAAVPSPISISTAGSLIDDPTDTGTMNLRITASDAIASTDLRVFVYLWEDNINRALWNPVSLVWDSPPYPNGETVLKWGVWDILPDGAGTAIWPSGAAAGSYVDIQYPLALNSTWVFAEIGATVFVQDLSSKEVIQSKVETFDNAPPAVTLTAPNPATAEQVLSGTVPITWTATDVEDAQATLDISIDYSANGGSTWTNIITGTDNNIAPYTYNWVTTGLPDGTGYKLRIKATDSGNNYRYATSTEAFTIENILNDEWFFQVEKTGTFNDLTVKPVENTANLAATASLSAAGEYKVGTWQTVQTFSGKTINGPWTFKTYGKTPNPGLVTLQATLYAKVFTSSNMVTPLDTTIYDDENVGSFTATHLFTWTDTLAGTITDGNTVVIEIWLHVTGGPYTQNSGATTNPGFDTAAAPWTYYDWDDAGPGTVTGSYVASGGNPGGFVQIACASETTGAGSTAYPYIGYYEQSFTSTFAPFVATLTFDWKVVAANTVDPLTMYFNVYVETATGIPTTSPVWGVESVATAPTSWASVNVDVSAQVASAGTYYVKIMFKHDSLQKGDGTYTGGYDNVLLSYSRPYSIFYMEYDYGTTRSSVVPTIGTGTGPTPAVYNIPLTGKSANSWVYVSFPIDITGAPNTILNDATLGDSGTTWTVAKSWDNVNKKWLTYRVGSTANTLTTINNQMGVWLWITANGGNQMLTTGVTGLYPTAGVGISLKAGWNMVGYPSATNRLASLTLPGVADRVSVWAAASPYITDYSDKSLVTMSQGNAYWVRVTADVTWTVNV